MDRKSLGSAMEKLEAHEKVVAQNMYIAAWADSVPAEEAVQSFMESAVLLRQTHTALVGDFRDVVESLRTLLNTEESLRATIEELEQTAESLRATIEELEQTAEAAKPQTLLDEQKAEILKKLTVLDLETLQHLENVLGLQFAPPYS